VQQFQAAASTGKAASNLHAPTVHGMLGWSIFPQNEAIGARKLSTLQNFYKDTEVFIIDEVNALSAENLSQLDETMTQLFNPKRKTKDGVVIPFGGKKVG